MNYLGLTNYDSRNIKFFIPIAKKKLLNVFLFSEILPDIAPAVSGNFVQDFVNDFLLHLVKYLAILILIPKILGKHVSFYNDSKKNVKKYLINCKLACKFL